MSYIPGPFQCTEITPQIVQRLKRNYIIAGSVATGLNYIDRMVQYHGNESGR